MARCRGQTKSGKQCSRQAQEGSDYCYQHQPEEKVNYEEMGLEELKECMTEKQKRFADHYIEIGDAKEAAIKAGYSEDSAKQIGYENFTKPYLRLYIDKIIAKKDNTRIASQDEVLEYLTSVMRGEIEEEQIVVESKGDYITEARAIMKQVGAKDRNKAAELLGKRYKIFTDNIDLNHSGGIQIIDDID